MQGFDGEERRRRGREGKRGRLKKGRRGRVTGNKGECVGRDEDEGREGEGKDSKGVERSDRGRGEWEKGS